MSEHRPLLVFPSFKSVKRDPGPRGGSTPSHPNRSKQSARLGPKFDALKKAFEAERIIAQEDPQGIEPDFALVIETRGRVEDFYTAAANIGMDWLGEIDLDDLAPDQDFHRIDNKTAQASDKSLDGRLYLAMTNQRALEELLGLWTLYKKDQPLGHGNTKWQDLFDYAYDIRRWSARDRLLSSGILEEWVGQLEDDPQAKAFFRLELWHRDEAIGLIKENRLRSEIEENGGKITARSRIGDIRFHAIKGYIPLSMARAALAVRDDTMDESVLPALFRDNGVKYFMPVAQGVTSLPQETEAFQWSAPLPSDQPPILALLDGYPFDEHDCLKGRLDVHDPDDLLSRYQPREMRHGTAMASLIVNGELDAHELPLTRKIYCRPVLEPDSLSRYQDGFAKNEHIPENAFAEDRIHRAVVEMLEGESATAPHVRIVNLSIGEQPFEGEVSAWARLVDWLAWKYKILFCVSVGNQTDDLQLGVHESAYSNLSLEEKIKSTLKYIGETQSNRKLLSPGEAINALTIGAQHTDCSIIPTSLGDSTLACRIDLLPLQVISSQLNRLGPGFRRAIKPDIVMPGGRQFYQYVIGSGGLYKLAGSYIAPGQSVAAPDSTSTGLTNQVLHTRGTSNATALASRAAARLYEVLEELKVGPGGGMINRNTTAVLLKALLVHGATWPDDAVEAIKTAIPSGRQTKRTIAKFLGYGIANPSRVESCAAQRATVLGASLLKQDEAHEYRLPLPIELSGVRQWRRLIITLAWLSPVNHSHRAYRRVKLSFSPPTKNPLLWKRQQADWQQTQKGTVQHEILEGDKIGEFVDGETLVIKVSAQGDTGQIFDDEIPYGLAITLETTEESEIPVYQRIKEKLSVQIRAST